MTVVDTDRQAVWNEYERWRTEKDTANKRGAMLLIGSVVVFFISMMVGLGKSPGLNEAAIFNLGRLLTSVLAFIGGAKIAESKGHSKLMGFFGIFTLLLGDKNVREAPLKPGTGVRPEGSAFSDW